MLHTSPLCCTLSPSPHTLISTTMRHSTQCTYSCTCNVCTSPSPSLQHQTLARDHSALRVDRVAGNGNSNNNQSDNHNPFNSNSHQQQEQLMMQVRLLDSHTLYYIHSITKATTMARHHVHIFYSIMSLLIACCCSDSSPKTWMRP